MNRRKFLGLLGSAPAIPAFSKLSWFQRWFEPKCKHVDGTGASTWIYSYYTPSSGPDRPPFAGIKICSRCFKQETFPWISYRVRFTTTMPPNSSMRIRYIDSDKAIS